jgi:hypothetical protein
MYKNKEEQKEANRKANKLYRDKQKGITVKGITQEKVIPESVTLSDGQIWHPDPRYYKPKQETEPVSDYPAIVQAITDPVRRDKLERITRELKSHNVSESVRYGLDGPDFDTVGELLDCVKL